MCSDVPAGERREEFASDPSQAEIERRVRSVYGPRLDDCARVHAFVMDALHDWNGPSIQLESVGPIIVAEGARATKTYGAVLRLLAGGFGPQAAMLSRSIFEGMAIAHWAHANPELAIERFKKHGRHSQLLWSDALLKAEPDEPPAASPATPEELSELRQLFGTYGTKLWTGHPSLHKLLPEIEDQWPDGASRAELWWFFRVAHRDNNQTLHSTALGLSAGVAQSPDHLALDIGSSDLQVDRALIGSLWVYHQTVTLVWDHFALPGREALDDVLRRAWSTLKAAAEKTRSDPATGGVTESATVVMSRDRHADGTMS